MIYRAPCFSFNLILFFGFFSQIAEQQDELKRRETRWNGSAARFRKRIEELENENYELKENLKLLEKERIQKWAKAEQVMVYDFIW